MSMTQSRPISSPRAAWIPRRSLVQMREAVRSLDDAAYYIDEEAARKR